MIDAEQQTEEQIEMTPSEKYYQNHLSRMREYNAKNRDKAPAGQEDIGTGCNK